MEFSQTGIRTAPRCAAVGPRTGIRCTKPPGHTEKPEDTGHEVRALPWRPARETWW